jgi:hypothetical protein
MTKRYLLALVLIILFQNQGFSQIKISGQIKDKKNNPIEFVEVQLQNKDSIIFKSELTNVEGKFVIETEKGEYSLIVRQLGVIYHKQKINVNQDTFIGIINITEKEQQLQEVVIISKKKLIERKLDKLILNIKGNEIMKGKNAIEVLKYAPFVWVDNESGNISIKGNNTLVLINGKISNMSSEDLKNYLNILPSEELESIEVISNPSSRYSAQGGSVINIITKKNNKHGLYTSLNSGLTIGKLISNNSSIVINSKINDKFSINTFFAHNESNNLRKENRIEILNSPLTKYNYNKIDTTQNKYNFISSSVLYQLNKKNQISLGFTLYDFNGNKKQDNDLLIESNINSTSKSNYITNNNNKYYTVSLNHNFQIDSLGQSLKTIVDFYKANNKSDNNYTNLFFNLNGNLIQSNDRKSYSPTNNEIFSVQTDYQKPFKTDKLEAGLKYSKVNNSNSTVFENKISGVYIPDTNLSNEFSYNEQIAAIYLSYSIDSLFVKNISIQAGLRSEYTKGNGEIPIQNYTLEKKYIDFFPSIFISKSLKKNNSLNLSYSRRINRPNYISFNPTIFYLTDFTSQIGNPDLSPSFTNAFEMGYNSSEINIMGYYENTRGEAREILKRITATTLQYQWRNIDRSDEIGISLSTNKKITKWLEFSINTSWYIKKYYSKFNDIGIDNINISKGTFQGRFSTAVILPLNYRSEISFEYNGSETYGQYHSGENYAFYFNASKKVNDKLSFYLKVVDPFGNLLYSFTNTQSELKTFQYRNNYSRAITFSVIYSFGIGNKTKSIKINNSNQDLKNRTN